MEKKHIITIAGKPGSGKSTTAKAVAAALRYDRFSSGDLFRTIARKHSLDVNDFNIAAETDKSIDELVDGKLRDIYTSENKLVIDSRMAWHWMPEAFNVYLNLELPVAAARIIAGSDAARREVEHIPDDAATYAAILERRLTSEAKRYKELYDVNPYDLTNYDLVVDTQKNKPDAAQRLILQSYELWLKT